MSPRRMAIEATQAQSPPVNVGSRICAMAGTCGDHPSLLCRLRIARIVEEIRPACAAHAGLFGPVLEPADPRSNAL